MANYQKTYYMETINRKIKTKYRWSSYILIFLLIYLTSAYYTTAANKIPGVILVFMLLSVAIISVIFNIRKVYNNFNIKGFLILLWMCIVSLASVLIHGDGLYHYAIIIFAVVSGYLFTVAYSFRQFINHFLNIMYFLSVFSLIVFFFVIISPSIFKYAPIIGQRVGVSVHNLFFTVVLPGAEFNRSYGLFWEPGAFQVYLSLALICELFSNEKIRLKYILVFIITIVTTFSTTGYISLGLILVAYIMNNKNLFFKYKHIYKYIIFTIIIALVILKLVPDEYNHLLFGKLEGLFSEGGSSNFSTSVRVNSIIYPFHEFIKSPLIGVGYERFLSMAEKYLYTMPTCTPINWFALFGISWGGPCIYYYLKNILRFKGGVLSKLILGVVLMVIIISEDFIRIAFIYVFIFYGTEDIKNEKCYKLKNTNY